MVYYNIQYNEIVDRANLGPALRFTLICMFVYMSTMLLRLNAFTHRD